MIVHSEHIHLSFILSWYVCQVLCIFHEEGRKSRTLICENFIYLEDVLVYALAAHTLTLSL